LGVNGSQDSDPTPNSTLLGNTDPRLWSSESPLGAGKRGFFTKTIAPSAVKLNFGKSLLASAASSLLFGTPRAMTAEDISLVIDQFVVGAKQSFEAGFKGIELHGA